MAERVCECGCGRSLAGRLSRTRYFDAKCRSRAFQTRKSGPPTVQVGTSDHLTYRLVWEELGKAGRVDTYLGAAALQLARRIDEATAVMGYAGLVKELRQTMDVALAGATALDDPIDELKARRDRVRAG